LPDSLARLVSDRVEGVVFGRLDDPPWTPPANLRAEDRAAAREALAAFERWLAPADPQHVAARVAALLAHYWVGAMPDGLQSVIAADWIEDLAGFPAHVVDEACRRWRRSEERKPTPAQILDSCERLVAADRRVRDRLRRIAEG
jgi:hypothetical protein